MNEEKAQQALAWRFRWPQQLVVPNVFFAGGEMDLAVVTAAGYLTEIEIKMTRADWQADQHKEKWRSAERGLVSRFYYAVPEELVGNPPEWVPATAGLIALQWHEPAQRVYTREVRPAERVSKVKLTDAQRLKLLESTYYRFWRLRVEQVAA